MNSANQGSGLGANGSEWGRRAQNKACILYSLTGITLTILYRVVIQNTSEKREKERETVLYDTTVDTLRKSHLIRQWLPR